MQRGTAITLVMLGGGVMLVGAAMPNRNRTACEQVRQHGAPDPNGYCQGLSSGGSGGGGGGGVHSGSGRQPGWSRGTAFESHVSVTRGGFGSIGRGFGGFGHFGSFGG
jgi:hypothetical protein